MKAIELSPTLTKAAFMAGRAGPEVGMTRIGDWFAKFGILLGRTPEVGEEKRLVWGDLELTANLHLCSTGPSMLCSEP